LALGVWATCQQAVAQRAAAQERDAEVTECGQGHEQAALRGVAAGEARGLASEVAQQQEREQALLPLDRP